MQLQALAKKKRNIRRRLVRPQHLHWEWNLEKKTQCSQIFTVSRVATPLKLDFTKDPCFMVWEEMTQKFLNLLIGRPQFIDQKDTIVLRTVILNMFLSYQPTMTIIQLISKHKILNIQRYNFIRWRITNGTQNVHWLFQWQSKFSSDRNWLCIPMCI